MPPSKLASYFAQRKSVVVACATSFAMSSSSKSSAANAPGFAEKTLGEEFGSIKVKKKEKEEKNENKKIKINVCIALL